MRDGIVSAFGNTARIKLMSCLSRGDKNVTELIANCGLSQSAVSQHLSKLRSCGLVSAQKRGKEVYYHLNFPQAATISTSLLSFIKEVKL